MKHAFDGAIVLNGAELMAENVDTRVRSEERTALRKVYYNFRMAKPYPHITRLGRNPMLGHEHSRGMVVLGAFKNAPYQLTP
jgi:hypothetical protein